MARFSQQLRCRNSTRSRASLRHSWSVVGSRTASGALLCFLIPRGITSDGKRTDEHGLRASLGLTCHVAGAGFLFDLSLQNGLGIGDGRSRVAKIETEKLFLFLHGRNWEGWACYPPYDHLFLLLPSSFKCWSGVSSSAHAILKITPPENLLSARVAIVWALQKL